jgi:hypothetical protein
MSWIRTVAREFVGLFVDDGSFALAIVVWLAVSLASRYWIGGSGAWVGPALVLGLAAILLENVARSGRRARK